MIGRFHHDSAQRSGTRGGAAWIVVLTALLLPGIHLFARVPSDRQSERFTPSSSPPSLAPSGGAAGGPQTPLLLVSSFVCFLNGCEFENAVLRYDANTGAYLGVHIPDIPGPTGMAIHPTTGHLLVAARGSDEVREYDAETGAFLGTFVTDGSGGLHVPQAILFKADGNLLVTSTQTAGFLNRVNGIIEYDGTTGEFVQVFINGGFLGQQCGTSHCVWGANDTALGPNGHLYVASGNNDFVLEYDGASGAYLNFFSSSQLKFPTGLAVRPAGGVRPNNILVAVKANPNVPSDTGKVLEFDYQTHALINPGGIFASGFDTPGPLFIQPDGTVLVSDRALWDVAPNFSDRIVRRNGASGADLGLFTPVHDTHLHWATGLLRVDDGCLNNAECDDGNPCTDDACDATHVCQNVNDNTNDPDDGLFCNGVEITCLNGTVVRLPPPNCDDGQVCTADVCNEDSDQCVNTLNAGHCLINGVCRTNGEINPLNACQFCDPATPSVWSPRPAGTACGNPADTDCNNPDTCNGSSGCLSNFEPAGTPCGNHLDTDCTDPDTCSATGACLANHAANGTPCEDGVACTTEDQCQTGICVGGDDPCTDPAQPFCVDQGVGHVCVECLSDGDCVDDGLDCLASSCRLTDHACIQSPQDSLCDDAQFCNGLETCDSKSGQCLMGANPCLQREYCDEESDRCVECLTDDHCDDGLLCNGAEVCEDGACAPGVPPEDCCKLDAECDNNNLCDGFETCAAGACILGEPLDCTDSNLCTADQCDPLTGCFNEDLPFGAPCGDPESTSCNHPDTCNGKGVCQANIEPNDAPCPDGIFCNGEETCQAGQCAPGTPVPNCCETDANCSNGDVCDGLERCVDHACEPGAPPVCDDENDCTVDVCDSELGCQITAASEGTLCGNMEGTPCNFPDTCDGRGDCRAHLQPNGTPCPDGVICNGEETCQAGTCVNGAPVPGCCKTDGDCGNQNVCDGLEVCHDNTCLPGAPLDCSDANDCTVDFCEPLSGCLAPAPRQSGAPCGESLGRVCDQPDTCDGKGHCQSNQNPDGTACPDGVFCNGEEVCEAGVCVPGDSVPGCCKSDSDCDNGNVCNGMEMCVNHSCMPGVPLNCEDGNVCTMNVCDPLRGCLAASPRPSGTPCGDGTSRTCDHPDSCDGMGQCESNHDPDGTACSDGLFCNGIETCETGVCVNGEPIPGCCKIDDDCDNHNVCDGSEICAGNTCAFGAPLDCSDDNDCTTDGCDPVSGCSASTPRPMGAPCGGRKNRACDHPDFCDGKGGCQSNHNPDGTTCPDGVFCNGEETCQSGLCVSGDPIPGCCKVNADCDNGNVCDGLESCVDHLCTMGSPLVCDDGDVCTDDVCDFVFGCQVVFNLAPCDDGDACTTGDACSGGACHGGPPAGCDGKECADCNHNGVRDECETLSDCDHDEIPDVCEPTGDADTDCDMDLRDVAAFQRCFTEEDGSTTVGCETADIDLDGDVDLVDLGLFRMNLTGP